MRRLALLACLLPLLGVGAEIRLPFYFGNHMTMQRERAVPVKGTVVGNHTGTVMVSMGRQHVKARVDGDGHFRAVLKPMKAGGPYTLRVSSDQEQVVLQDVVVGDVWVCSGQSNMAFELAQAQPQPTAESLEVSGLRLLMMRPSCLTSHVAWEPTVLEALNEGHYWLPSQWEVSREETAQGFSAVGYLFGQQLQEELGIPIGLICNAVGGAPTESYVDSLSLQREMPAIYEDFDTNEQIQDWVRYRAGKNIERSSDRAQQWHPYKPTCLYTQGVAPLGDFPVKGVVWYQGESNAHDVEGHEVLMRSLVASWRQTWEDPTLPFYFVQLSSIGRPTWPAFRHSQRMLSEELTHTGMAVSSDWGDSLDVHPRNKRPVGERLARLALHRTYGRDIEDQGPTPRRATSVKGLPSARVVVSYDHAEGLRTADGKEALTFELADTGTPFYPATAVVDSEAGTVTLSCKELRQARYFRYGWQPYTRANLINAEGLPASTWMGLVEE